jgi:GDPmannose 4,6-dehydratase
LHRRPHPSLAREHICEHAGRLLLLEWSVKRALITGITGQNGSYLSELLVGKGYQVHGLVRRARTFNTERLQHLHPAPRDLGARYGDVGDGRGLRRILERVRPDEIYKLAAQSHVRMSFDQPEYTDDAVDAMWHMLQPDRPDDYVVATGRGALRSRAHCVCTRTGL